MASAASFAERLLGRDGPSVALLFLLYTLQGIPMGLSGSVPFLLSGKISYKQQSLLSLVSLPFSLKLLWAPLVDALHSPRIGRRRSWLLPVQFLAGSLMVWGGAPERIMNWIGDGADGQTEPNVESLTLFFGILYFLMATQDIAVDGWALTMLSADNKGMASTCNTVGQTLGYFVSYVGFLALNDPQTCRRFLPAALLPAAVKEGDQPAALLDLAGFLRFWGWVIIGTTAAVLLFFPEEYSSKAGAGAAEAARRRRDSLPARLRAEAALSAGPLGAPGEEVHLFTDEILAASEKPAKTEDSSACRNSAVTRPLCSASREDAVEELQDADDSNCEPEGVVESYILLWKLLFLPPVRTVMALLLTCRIAFAGVDAATQLKLIERGVKKEDLALFAPLILPLGIICPMVVGRFLRGCFPLRLFSYGYVLRMAMCLVWSAAVGWTGRLLGDDAGASMSSGAWTVFYGALFVITGLYNVCSDLMFVSQVAFFAQVSDPRIGGTYMTFLNTVTNLGVRWPNTLSLLLMDTVSIQDCSEDGQCFVVLDAYFVQIAACFLAGMVWLALSWRRIEALQHVPPEEWRVTIARSEVRPHETEESKKDL
ncbi:putative Acetyl-coenzyme A transporter [Besnoitia besnoiti]|uniref:Putative Acetyl-coenzyme A transporter n=1 Tax=Besnoitia besnoiti TaxID=94643 RepID=A0A2A9MAB1_BESBE|nr:putative Acetyl-coenzyme A transporter [Besnoitia besnoiti]PFH34925.1 putative Acetyl-coenzyme A transporter [Besnoitia besnoiti]